MNKNASNILETIMREEITAITTSPAQVVSYNYRVEIHTPTLTIPALMVSSVNLLRDYYTRFGDVVSLQASFAMGDVLHRILPYHTQLEITLIKIPLQTNSKYEEITGAGNRVIRYTAKLYNAENVLLEGKQMEAASQSESNKNNLIALDFQLISRDLEELRVKTFGSIIRKSNGADAIRAVLMCHCLKTRGVDVEPGYSAQIKEHITVPHQSRVVDIPKLINKLVGGLYPTGFRYYMQGSMWYLYSPYNVKRYDTSPTTLTIINLPKDKLSQMEVTFRKVGGQVIILATGDTSHFDESETSIQNQGNGFKFVDSNKVFQDFGEIKDNKFIVNRTKNVTQVVNKNQERAVNIAPEISTRVTSGYNLEYSEVMRRAGSLVQVQWESSEIDHIHPGMPVRYMYMDSGLPKEIYGRVIATETKSRQTNRSPTQRIFTNDSILTVFVSNSGVPEKDIAEDTTPIRV